MTTQPVQRTGEDIDRHVSENVNTLLLRARMSRRALALATGGISHAAINRKMTGGSPWTLAEVQRVASALGVTLAELTTDLPSFDEWQVRWELQCACRDSNPKPSDLVLIVNHELTPESPAGFARPSLRVVGSAPVLTAVA